MPTLDQAFTALQAALQGEPPNQTIDLVAASGRVPLGPLAEPLALLRIATAFPVDAATLTRPRDQLLVSGSGRFALPGGGSGLPVAVRMTVTEPVAGTLAFAVALTVTQAGWTFSSTFPTLPHTLRADPSDPGVAFGASTVADLRVDAPTFTARSGSGQRVQLTGSLQPSGDLAAYRGWFDGWPLTLDGTVSLPATTAATPDLDLRAVAPEARISVPPLSFQRPGFAIVAGPEPAPDDPDLPVPPPYSELQLIGQVTIDGAPPIVARLSGSLLVGQDGWRLLAEFDGSGPSIVGGLAQLASLFGIEAGDLRTPPGLGGFESFTLDEVEAWVDGSPAAGLTGLSAIAATIRSTTSGEPKVWKPPIPFLSVTDVGTRWVLSWVPVAGRQQRVVAGSVFGSFVFTNAPGQEDGIVDVVGQLPSFVIEGEQRDGTVINVGAAFRQLMGRSLPAVPGDPTITELTLYADPFGQIFSAGAALTVDWPVPFFSGLSITELEFDVSATASSLSGAIGGRLQLGVGPTAAALRLRAESPPAEGEGSSGWIFSGGLEPEHPLTVGALLRLISLPAPSDLDALRIDRLDGSIDTGDDSWTLSGAFSARWSPRLLGTTIDVAAGVEVDLRRPDQTKPASGWVAGSFSVNRFRLRLQRDVGVLEPTYALRVELGALWLNAATAWVDDRVPPQLADGVPRLPSPNDSPGLPARITTDDPPRGRHQVVAIQLGGATLGELLEEIVRRAAPTLGFSLDPPWDVLGRIELSRFTLTIDPTDRVVALTYAVDADLLVMQIDTIGVRYAMGASSKVDLILTGSFLGKPFRDQPGSKPLAWDVVNDPPPAVPGKGPKLLELRYLGLGQRIRLKDPQPDTVADAIARLRKEMPERDPNVNPLVGSEMVFDAASQWLVALDLRVLETVQVGLVFSDPRLYGLFIALDGERAGPLAGLRFEVLYKQLAPGLGMFRIELRVPEAFRHIELGEVSITLGTIVVEIYTNGNFLIDLGFPHGRDYTRAFTVQVFPFIGRGGIYFGVLNGATSRRVPQITNGTFSPVLELGIGLAVGVGKEISIGPLSGGAYVELEVIFQGVLAWFHPTGSDVATDRYHWAQGIVAIHGKVYGEVDFAVVKASVTLEAYAQATVVFESYRATRFALEVRVRAEAEIEILFITVSFSFDVELDLSFTVGRDEQAPWTLAAVQPPRVSSARAPHRLAEHQRAPVLLAAARADGEPWSWPTSFSAFGAPRTLALSVLPAFAIADAPVSSTSTAPPSPAVPDWRMAFPLFAPNGIAPTARTAAQASAPAVDDGDPVAAASIVEAFLRWALNALPTGVSQQGQVTAGELALLAEQLTEPYIAEQVFTRDRLAAFFASNLHLRISGDDGTTAPVGAMAFPPPPWLAITATGSAGSSYPGGRSDLFAASPVGPRYAEGVAAYMAGFAPVAPLPGEQPPDDPNAYQSFAAQVFRDWCLLLTREAVRQAGLALAGTTVAMAADLATTAATLPRDVVAYPVRPGDTVASMAAWLGAGRAELEALNPGLAERLAAALPGTRLDVTVGVAACTLAVDNATRPLAPDVTVPVTDVALPIRSQDSLDGLSQRAYGAAAAARLVTEASLATQRRLLRSGAAVAVPLRTGMGADLALLAASAYVRYFADLQAPHADWYAQAVAELNQDALRPLLPGEAIPAGLAFTVPTAFGATTTTSYTTRIGDSLLTIGATLSLAQAPAAYDRNPTWKAFRAQVLADQGGTVPATPVAILPGETLALLADRLLVAGGVPALLPWLEAAPVLDPLAVVRLPLLPLATATHPTLAAIAATAGLTVEALSRRPEIATTAGLFPARTQLDVRHLPAQAVDAVVAAVCGGDALAAISTQVSRTLLGGLRLPAPVTDPVSRTVTATGPMTAFAALAGWQLPAPPLDGTTGLTVTIGASGPAQGWIALVGGPQPGTAGCAYDNAGLASRYPADALARPPARGPAAIAVVGSVPRTYGLEHRIDLQAAVVPAIPGTDTGRPAGAPALWRFPSSLLARARAATTIAFDVLRPTTAGSVAGDTTVAASTFGTLVPLTIRRVEGRKHVYELLGADTVDRELLRELALYARADTPTARSRLYLAIAPVPGATDPRGLALLDASPTATFAVRANMASDIPLAAPPTVLTAGLGDVARFLQLAWEASVAAGGYHLAFATADGRDLPAGAFDQDGSATLWLVAIARDQLAPKPNGRTLLPTDNCVLVADGLDASAPALYVEAHDARHQPAELEPQALVPAGSTGITLTIARPLPPLPTAPVPTQRAARLAQLLSLLVVEIDGTTYAAPRAAPPAPPQREDGLALPAWQRQRLERALLARGEQLPDDPPAAEYWRYDQVVPISTFGPPSPAPTVTGLPAPAADPYRGFGTALAKATATFRFRYTDVLGNMTQEPSGAALDIDVGYTDPLLGPSAWPGCTSGYRLDRAQDVVTLTVAVTSQPATAVPAPGDARAPAADAAGRQAARYAEAYFQLAQSVTGSIVTSLHQDPSGAPLPVELVEGLAPLWRFTAAAYRYTSAAAALVDVPLAGLATLGDLTARYGVAPSLLGPANADRGFGLLVAAGQPLTVAAGLAVTEGDSAATLLTRVPDGWPVPASASALLQNDPNPALPLRPETVLAITPITVVLPADPSALSLDSVAHDHHTSVAQLAIDNAARPILRTGFAFAAGGETVTVDGTTITSFEQVQTAFATRSVDVAVSELADAAAKATAIFADAASLSIAHLVARPGDSLASLGAPGVPDLADHNGDRADLFPAGTVLSLGTTWPTAPTVPADPLETLGQFAAVHGTTPALVLAANPGLRLADTPEIMLPGVASLPAAAPLVPYALQAGDRLTLLQPLFGATPLALAEANDRLPGLLVVGRTITVTVDGTGYATTTVAGDTLAAVTERLQAQRPAIDLAAVVAAIQDDATLLAPGGLLLTPAPPLAARGTPGAAPLTAAQVAAAYGIDALAFAQANAALAGLLVPGIDLQAPRPDPQAPPIAPERTTTADSLNAVLGRFAARGVAIDLRGLLAANAPTPLFVAGVRVLLPPTTVTVSAPIGDGSGPFRDPVLPLTVDLRLQRPRDLVLAPTPNDDGPVERAETRVPAPTAPSDRDGHVSETFDAFVTAFERALPNLRLGTARVEGTTADLWAVDFGAQGIASVAVTPPLSYPDGSTGHPRFLALRPLYPALQSRPAVPVPVLDDNGAIVPGRTTPTAFQGVDVEGWATSFLADLDRFSTAAYTTAIRANAASSTALDTLLAARWKLTGGIAAGLAPVLAIADPDAAAGRAAAVAELARAYGSGLSSAYAIATVLQFDAAVSSAYAVPARGLAPARLIGGAHPPNRAAGPDDRDFSLATATTALDAARSYVGFAMSVPDPSHHATIATGPLEYVYDSVQFAIDPVAGVDGYVDSDWVTLVRPLTGSDRPAHVTGDLGSPVVPVPLRAHPPVPLVLGQTAEASYVGEQPPTLAQASQWTFGLSYSHEHAEQDEVLLAVTFNVAGGPQQRLVEGSDLAAALGRYAVLGPQLRNLMAWYVDPPNPAPTNLQAVRDAVATTVATLATGIADAWASHWPNAAPVLAAGRQDELPAGDSYHFRVAVDYDDGPGQGDRLTALRLSLDGGASPGPGDRWPTVGIRDADGTFVPLTGTVTGTTCRYVPAQPLVVSGWPAVRLEWPELPVATVGNGHASLSARRNEHLLPGIPTTAAFVLSSASVTAPDVATPLLEWHLDLPIAGASLAAALTTAFGQLFGSTTGPPLTVSIDYGHELVAPDPDVPGSGIISVLPVALYPHQPLSATLPAEIGAAASTWIEQHRPATAGGSWLVSLTLSSWLDEQTSRPLLVLDRLVHRIAD